MTDTNKLRALIKSKGLKYTFIAEKLGISTYCLQMKIDNRTEFKTTEVQIFCEILGIEDNLELKETLFFATKVDK